MKVVLDLEKINNYLFCENDSSMKNDNNIIERFDLSDGDDLKKITLKNKEVITNSDAKNDKYYSFKYDMFKTLMITALAYNEFEEENGLDEDSVYGSKVAYNTFIQEGFLKEIQ